MKMKKVLPCIRRKACVCPTIKLKPNVKIYKRLATVEKRRNVTSIPTDSNCLFFFQLRNDRKKEEKQPLYIHVRLLFINRRHVTTTQSASRAEYLRVFGIGFHEREERKREDKKRNSLSPISFFGSCQTIIRDA